MPQPDNQRERGAVTQGSQQQVAPQGQMAANISPISGGAAAAAPVLQIGQQAQIKQTGAELYQALAGISSGVQQGLQNYEKMFNLVSESQYADFETAYVAEVDRVKGDSAKVKTWLDNNSYKPNRITAKRFQTLRAGVNGKAYEDDQMDQWYDDLNRTSKMNSIDALDYLNGKIDQHDENSPYFKQARSRIIELQSSVANVATQNNLNALRLGYTQENLAVTQQLQSNPTFAQNLADPAFKLALTLKSLGQATVDGSSGKITLNSGKTFDVNSAGDFIPQMQTMLDEGMGNGTLRPDHVAQAMSAANLPDSVMGKRPGISQPIYKSVAEFTGLVSIGDGDAVRGWLGNSANATPETLGNTSKVLEGTFKNIISDQTMPPEERARMLQELQFALDYEAGSDVWTKYGIENEEQFNTLFQGLSQQVTDAHNMAVLETLGPAFTIPQDGVTSLSEHAAMQRAIMVNKIIPSMATISNNANVLMYDPKSDGLIKMSMEEYEQGVASSWTTHVGDDGTIPNYLPVGIEVIDAELGGAKDVPFMVKLDENNEFVFVGNGNETTKQAERLRQVSHNSYVTAQAAENLIGNVEQDNTLNQIAFDRIVRANPMLALQLLGDPRREKNNEIFSTGDTGKATFDILFRTFDPSGMMALPAEQRADVLRAWSLAYHKSDQFKNYLSARSGDESKPFYEALAVAPMIASPDLSPEQLTDAVAASAATMSNSGVWNTYVAANDKLRTSIDDITTAYAFGVETAGIAGLRDTFQDSEDPNDQYQAILLENAVTSYRTRYGTSLEEDVMSVDEATKAQASIFLNAHLKHTRDISKMGNLTTPEALRDHLTNNIIDPANAPIQSDRLYASDGRSATSQDQAIDQVISVLISEAKGLKDAVAPGFGLADEAQLERFRTFLNSGQVPKNKEEADMFKTLRRKLSEGISIIPMPISDEGGGYSKDSEGRLYQPYHYRITLNESMVAGEGWFDWSAASRAGIRADLFETIRGRAQSFGALERWQYRDAPPQGLRTGSELKAAEHVYLDWGMSSQEILNRMREK